MICDACHHGRHRRCAGCDCALCPIVLRKPSGPTPGIPPPRKHYVPRGTPMGRPPGSTLDEPLQILIANALRGGESMSALSRRYGISRDQVRTVKRDMQNA